MDTITPIIFDDNTEYYLADDLFKIAKIFCKGSRNPRQLIEKNNISKKDYIFSRIIDDEWNVTDGKSKKFDKVLISKKYAEKNIPEFSKTAKYDIEMAPPIINLKKMKKLETIVIIL